MNLQDNNDSCSKSGKESPNEACEPNKEGNYKTGDIKEGSRNDNNVLKSIAQGENGQCTNTDEEKVRSSKDSVIDEKASVNNGQVKNEESSLKNEKRPLDENDDSSLVATHYNKRPAGDKEEREKSDIIFIRNFNNWAKAVLIQLAVKEGYRVLDLGCGKGGDLQKWKKQGVSLLFGIG